MKFTPKTADELARDNLLPAGIYPFEVMEATDTLSRAGNDMIKLKLVVFGPDGETPHVFDYLLEKLAYKLRHFAEVTGLLPQYESGDLTALHCMNRQGYVKLAIEEQEGYSPKNSVKDYEPAPEGSTPRPVAATRAAPVAAAAAAAGFDDDIPFNRIPDYHG